ncbi:MAG: CRTAC1 family protein [Verrucomicrobiales bacterium]|nr:CRTAC1 family protein [Verrucomicrobiales bacterium]
MKATPRFKLAGYSRSKTPVAVTILALCALPFTTRAGFVEVNSGITFTRTYYNGGASWGDFDGDGHLDLFVTLVDGGGTTRLNVLYRNLGDGRFEVPSADRIGELHGDAAFSVQGLWADLDNDGDLDLYVVNRVDRGGSTTPLMDHLFLNDGKGVFTRHPVAGTDAPDLRANSGSLTDFDGDGHLDLFLPDWGQNSGTPDAFFRNEGNLQFSRVMPLRARSSLATSGAWADFDGDGDLDVVVANQDDAVFIYKNLLRETGVPGFVAVTGGTAEARGLRFAQSGCLVWGDFNNDGLLDLVLSHDNAGFQIYFATPGGEYELRRRFAGIGVRMLALLDADNDGHLDLITDMTSGDGGYRLYLNQGDGTAFTESSLAPARQFSYVQSAPAVGDFNNDGYPDVFIVYPGLPGALFANVGGDNRWLKLNLQGTSSNGSGIGAVVRVRATIRGEEVWQMRQVSAGGEAWRVQHDDLRPNFGLGDATKADVVRIEWPSGAVQELTDVAANQILTVTEPPVLVIEPAVILAWPVRAEGYVPYAAETAEGPWQRLDAPVTIADGRSTITVKARDRMRYYQLQQP